VGAQLPPPPTYRDAAEKDHATATVNMDKNWLKFCHVVSEISEWTDRQTRPP